MGWEELWQTWWDGRAPKRERRRLRREGRGGEIEGEGEGRKGVRIGSPGVRVQRAREGAVEQEARTTERG